MTEPLIISELSSPAYKRTHAADYTAASFPARPPTMTQPWRQTLGVANPGDGVLPLGLGGYATTRDLILVPYGTGAAGTMSLRLIGWRPTNLGGIPLWVPSELGTWVATFGTSAGVVGSDLGAAYLFATSFTFTGGPLLNNAAAPNTVPPTVGDWFHINAAAATGQGSIWSRNFGFPAIEVLLALGTATAGNCLFATM